MKKEMRRILGVLPIGTTSWIYRVEDAIKISRLKYQYRQDGDGSRLRSNGSHSINDHLTKSLRADYIQSYNRYRVLYTVYTL
jgi:hypothetical protein